MNTSQPGFAELLGDLNAGVFLQQIESALSDTSLGVVTTGRKGKVVITLDLKRIGESNQVAVTHKLNYVKPTHRGRATEEYATETPMHVGPRGALSLFPGQQLSMFDANKDNA